MSVLRNIANRVSGNVSNYAPVDMTGGKGIWGGTWRSRASKATSLGVSEWNSTIYGIVDMQATAQAQINWRLFRQAPQESNREEVFAHPALSVWNQPNRFYTQDDLIEVLFNHYELTGEMWLLVGRASERSSAPPVELWPIRPDRMRPVADPREFISGYVYSPGVAGNDDVALGLDEVIYDWKRHPTDPYRGQSPISAALCDLRSDREASEYNTNFFMNNATPGGMLKVGGRVSTDAWKELRSRLEEQHKGTRNAHRLLVLDNLKDSEFVDLKYTRKDMEFVDLRNFNVNTFRRAYRLPKFALGEIDDVNRASAEASAVWFSHYHVIPRAERLKKLLNYKFLPMFGSLGRGYEFDYDDPTPPDREQSRKELESNVNLALQLINAGFDEGEVLEYLDLPALSRTAAPVVPAPVEEAPAGAGDHSADMPMEEMMMNFFRTNGNGHKVGA